MVLHLGREFPDRLGKYVSVFLSGNRQGSNNINCYLFKGSGDVYCWHLHGCFGIGTLGCLLRSTTRLTCFPYIRGHTWPEEILHVLVFGSYCADMSCHWCGVCQLDHFIVPSSSVAFQRIANVGSAFWSFIKEITLSSGSSGGSSSSAMSVCWACRDKLDCGKSKSLPICWKGRVWLSDVRLLTVALSAQPVFPVESQ